MKKILYILLFVPFTFLGQNTAYVEQDAPLELQEGWNMFGYSCYESQEVISAFEPIVGKITIVKDNSGAVYVPEFGFNGIGNLQYNRGYQIKTIQAITDFQFCPAIVPLIEGCMDATAFNYNEAAHSDDGSCYPVVLGCLDPTAFNFNDYDGDLESNELSGINGVDVNTGDGSCFAIIYGCLDPEAFNYNDLDGDNVANELIGINGIDVNTNDGSCIYYGCTDPNAFNYDSAVNTDDGSCVSVVVGCTDSLAYNYNVNANIDDGSCIDIVYGCTNPFAFNYNPTANTNDNSCVAVVHGCTDVDAINYSENANTDDGSCVPSIAGCMEADAFNYDSQATSDDGSCLEVVYGCTGADHCNYNPEANTDDGSCIYPELGYDCDGNIVPQYQVGDLAEGGIIFQINEDGTGLVSALEDLTEGATDPYGWGYNGYEWGCYQQEVNGADGTTIGTGYQNTMDIVNQGCTTDQGGITAAQAALDAEINGYSDWYLPSKDELVEMCNTIGNGGPEGNIGGFETSGWVYYWSSSENNNYGAWFVNFSDGNANYSSKDNTSRVRVIRAF